jgi:hypothetical protein
MRRHASLSARRLLPLAEDGASLLAHFAWAFDRFPTEGSARQFSTDRSAMITLLVA